MPLVRAYTDIDGLIAEKDKVSTILHNAVKSALGKPDQYITVVLSRAETLTVKGEKQGVVIIVESIGGSLGSFISSVCEGLAELGVDQSQVTATFRSVDGKEFAMNGATIF